MKNILPVLVMLGVNTGQGTPPGQAVESSKTSPPDIVNSEKFEDDPGTGAFYVGEECRRGPRSYKTQADLTDADHLFLEKIHKQADVFIAGNYSRYGRTDKEGNLSCHRWWFINGPLEPNQDTSGRKFLDFGLTEHQAVLETEIQTDEVHWRIQLSIQHDQMLAAGYRLDTSRQYWCVDESDAGGFLGGCGFWARASNPTDTSVQLGNAVFFFTQEACEAGLREAVVSDDPVTSTGSTEPQR